MSKNETTQGETKNEVSQGQTLDIAGIQEMAKNLKPSGDELVTNYYDFAVGEEVKILPLGVKRIDKLNPSKEDWDNKRPDEDKPRTDAIRFLNVEDGQFYITAAAVICSSLKQPANDNEAVGSVKKFYLLACTGEKESSKGKYQTFSIKPLV